MVLVNTVWNVAAEERSSADLVSAPIPFNDKYILWFESPSG